MKEIVYTPLPLAVDELAARRGNQAIVDRVLEYIGNDTPDSRLLEGAPAVISGDYVARGTTADVRLARQVLDAGGQPYWATYDDAYSGDNPVKASIVKPEIMLPSGAICDRRIVTRGDREGGMMTRRTIFGTSLAEYHAMLRREVFIGAGLAAVDNNVFDMGPWYRSQAERFAPGSTARLAERYIVARTALGVLCAQAVSYDTRHYASGFMDAVVLPAIERVRKDIGMDPIFVRRPPLTTPHFNLNEALRGRDREVVVAVEGKGKRALYAVKDIVPKGTSLLASGKVDE